MTPNEEIEDKLAILSKIIKDECTTVASQKKAEKPYERISRI
jgi:hypothetical protein